MILRINEHLESFDNTRIIIKYKTHAWFTCNGISCSKCKAVNNGCGEIRSSRFIIFKNSSAKVV